ncbi:MAG: hypothetical protein ACSHXD_07215 [Marinosulfonomonas sp.]
MKPHIIVAMVLVGMSPAHADETCELKMESAYLTEYFCSAFKDISDAKPKTRSMTDETDTSDDGLDPNFAQVGIIKEAYRTDPRKTLELIERIKSAGGVIPQ